MEQSLVQPCQSTCSFLERMSLSKLIPQVCSESFLNCSEEKGSFISANQPSSVMHVLQSHTAFQSLLPSSIPEIKRSALAPFGLTTNRYPFRLSLKGERAI